MKRGVAWRRHQAQKVVQKRLNILKIWCSSSHWEDSQGCYEKTEEYQVPGYLKKWNFTCDCSYCAYNKDGVEDSYRNKVSKQEKRDIEREYCESYNFYL